MKPVEAIMCNKCGLWFKPNDHASHINQCGRVTIAWTPEMLASFKTVIERAKLEGASGFEFNGNHYDRRYAEYLAEYLEGVFKARRILK